jgi:hypothetical protein
MQPQSITPRRANVASRLLLAAILTGNAVSLPIAPSVLAQAAQPARSQGAGALPGGTSTWRESPEHVRLFAPEAHQTEYQAFVTTEPLDTVLGRVTVLPHLSAPGSWVPEPLGPRDAFGLSAPYNRFLVARLYTAGPARVARGPHDGAQGLETWTLVSPYPRASLRALDAGTLLLVFRVPPL